MQLQLRRIAPRAVAQRIGVPDVGIVILVIAEVEPLRIILHFGVNEPMLDEIELRWREPGEWIRYVRFSSGLVCLLTRRLPRSLGIEIGLLQKNDILRRIAIGAFSIGCPIQAGVVRCQIADNTGTGDPWLPGWRVLTSHWLLRQNRRSYSHHLPWRCSPCRRPTNWYCRPMRS